MKTRHGDLIELALAGEFDVIVHGCNCFHTMGAGIAKSIKHAFPEAYAADLETAKGDRDKLGSLSVAKISNTSHPLVVVNAYTQFNYRGAGPRVDYGAIKTCFEAIAERFADLRIGYPMIGAGLAGGDWARISDSIEKALAECDHTLVVFAPQP